MTQDPEGPPVMEIRLTHIGGPTVLIEVGDWRWPARRSPRPISPGSTRSC